MSASKYIPELLEAKLIDEETAGRIRAYYEKKKSNKTSRVFVVFSILGALLVGLGIILIIAHNWDDLTITVKAVLAFVPLIIGQALCAFVLLRQSGSVAWREASAIFVSLAVGATMALVSQIYNIPGNFASFMLTWVLLVLPVVYVMHSSVASLLYICGVTIYGVDQGYFNEFSGLHLFWILLAAILPFYYYNLIRRIPGSNYTIVHNWLLPLAVIILLGSVAHKAEAWMYPTYVSLFGVYLLLGNLPPFDHENGFRNAFQILGFLGTLVVLISLSFSVSWEQLHYPTETVLVLSREFLLFAGISAAAIGLAYFQNRRRWLSRPPVLELFFLVFAITFAAGLLSGIGVVMMNIYVLALGVWVIVEGERRDHLGVLNLGLAIITMLTICRFFDSDITFIVRGLIFLGVGVGFFLLNYRMIKKRRYNA